MSAATAAMMAWLKAAATPENGPDTPPNGGDTPPLIRPIRHDTAPAYQGKTAFLLGGMPADTSDTSDTSQKIKSRSKNTGKGPDGTTSASQTRCMVSD